MTDTRGGHSCRSPVRESKNRTRSGTDPDRLNLRGVAHGPGLRTYSVECLRDNIAITPLPRASPANRICIISLYNELFPGKGL